MIDHGGQGDFAAHHRDGEHVIKVLDVQHPAGARFVAAALATGRAGMDSYLSMLRAAGVALPPDLVVVSTEPLAVRHRWVTGPVLLDHAVVDPARFVSAVAEIVDWVNALADTDARVDTNLANFCLTNDGVVLVDVLPPLIRTRCPEPSNLFEVLFTALCFDTTVIHDALIGYAARALLRASAEVEPRHRNDLLRLARPVAAVPVGEPFPRSWFRARLVLAMQSLRGEVSPDMVHEFFALTSVRVFRELPEAHRARRIRQVGQTIEELALP